MSLFDIRNKLYKKHSPKNISEHDISQYDPSASKTGAYVSKEDDLWSETRENLVITQKKAIIKGLIALGIILGIILVSVIIFEIRQGAFKNGNAYVSVSGPEQIEGGQLTSYEVKYKNNNWISVENAEIKISYPENFKLESDENFTPDSPTSGIYRVGTVGMRSSGKIVFSGKAYSPKGALIYLKADLSYKPFSFLGQFKANAQLGVNVIPAPIILEIQGQQNIASGNAVEYVINYQNDGNESLNDLHMKMEYPEGFTFLRSDPIASEGDNIWQLGGLKAGVSGKAIINGRLEGAGGMTRTAKVSIGVMNNGEFVSYNDETVDTQIIASPLLISQTVNEQQQLNVEAGQYLQFRITYKNTGNIGLRDVIVTEKLDSPVLDYASLDMKGGSFDAASKSIIWKASDIVAFKNLNPGQQGEIAFSIHVKGDIPLDGYQKKNFIIVSLAKIDSPDVPTPISANKIISSNEMDIKLNSKMILVTKGYYDDTTIPNSGPIPPRVGQETTYTIHWKAMNVSNDISNVKVSASLPTNATMTGKIFPDDARLNYNERSNSIVWDIGKMDAGTGILNSPLEVAFQVRIKPTLEQIGKEVGLLGVSTLSATDLFTKDALTVTTAVKDTSLFEDRELTMSGGGRVSN